MSDEYGLAESQAYYEWLDEVNDKWATVPEPPKPRDYTSLNLPLWTNALTLSDEEFYELQELRRQYPVPDDCDVMLDFWTGEEIP